MSIKRMLVLAMALAAIALAGPAAASANQFTWTDRHVPLGPEDVTDPKPFEGVLTFERIVPPEMSFACEVTVLIVAEGETGGTVTKFQPTTETCEGGGILTGCELVHDTSNIEEGWAIELTPETDARVFATEGNLTTLSIYDGGCAVPGTHLEFAEATLDPVLDEEGTIDQLDLTKVDVNGEIVIHGSLLPEGERTLGLEAHE